jgi:hypothetical protein
VAGREAVGAFAEAVIRSVELIVQPDSHDVVGEMSVCRQGSGQGKKILSEAATKGSASISLPAKARDSVSMAIFLGLILAASERRRIGLAATRRCADDA